MTRWRVCRQGVDQLGRRHELSTRVTMPTKVTLALSSYRTTRSVECAVQHAAKRQAWFACPSVRSKTDQTALSNDLPRAKRSSFGLRGGSEYANAMDKELWFVAPNQVELRDMGPRSVPPGHVRVQGLYSAVSHGTEGLLITGLGPSSFDPSLDPPERATYPRRYGYAWVGQVHTPGDLCGALVFALRPHGTAHVLDPAEMRLLPPSLSPLRATLAAAMETALNAIWDAELKVGERVVVFGGGTIGLLVSHLATAVGAQVTLVEPRLDKHQTARQLGVTSVVARFGDLAETCDVAFEASGDPQALDGAIACCGFEARAVVVSFYGAKTAPVQLGDRFHRYRLRLISSQVSTIPSALRGRFDFARRFEVVCRLLGDARLDALTQNVVPFENAVQAYAQLARGEVSQQVIFEY